MSSCLDNFVGRRTLPSVLDTAAVVPLYARIAARLRAHIAAGEYPPGSRIPSEHELASRFAVGRPTVRQATELLVRERLLERRRGSGTYVNDPPPEVDLFSAGGTVASFERSGLSIDSRLLGKVARRSIPADASHPFAGRDAFFLARRTRLGRVPVLLEEMYLDPAVFAGLDRFALEGQSLSRLAREHYLLRPESIEQRFRLVTLDPDRSARLALESGHVLLKVERTIDFYGAARAFFAELYCRADHVVFTQSLGLAHGGRASTRNS